MRTHSQIVRDYGVAKLHERLTALGFTVSEHAPKRWIDRDSIPDDYWFALQDEGVASLEELAKGADPRVPVII